jgi:hypothetical protein
VCLQDGITALQLAVSNGFLPITVYLIEHCGVKVEQTSDDGSTALHAACRRNSADTAKYLIEKGASLETKDRNGKTPLDLCNSLEFCHLLIRKGKAIELLLTEVKAICFESGLLSDLDQLLKENPDVDITKLSFVRFTLSYLYLFEASNKCLY